MARSTMEGSANKQAALWGARPGDWAANEAQQAPTYEEAIRRLALAPGDAVLDVGCGAGTFLSLAATWGARTFGLDAADTLIAIARERAPEADLHVGDLQWLPYEDDAFDVVTGFTSFFFAADMQAALGEAARVTRPGGSVLIQVWGRPERCDLAAMIGAMRGLRAAEPADTPPLWRPGVLEGLAQEAGLRPREAYDHSYAYTYPDERALVRAMAAAGGVVEAARIAGHEAVYTAIVDSLAPFRAGDGSYRLENEWHHVIATA